MASVKAKTYKAWLLEWPQQPLALATCEVVEIVDAPEIHEVPFGPDWCRGMVVWRDQLLALAVPEYSLQLSVEKNAAPLTVVIVAMQAKALAPLQYAAIGVYAHPRQIDVQDGLDCDLPHDSVLPMLAARACFQIDGRAVLVPDLNSLFGSHAA